MKVLVISVHPDDETLGCGGTLLKHSSLGDELYWMIITKPDESLGYTKKFIENRKKEIERVAECYNFVYVHKLNFPATKLHSVEFNELLTDISEVINHIRPDIVYMNNRSDIHTDHQVAAKAIISATKSFRYPFIKKIMMYECISETEIMPPFPENMFIPNVFSDITDFLEEKLEIMKIYSSELQPVPSPRELENIKALARYRGASCGVFYAEAFMLVRERF